MQYEILIDLKYFSLCKIVATCMNVLKSVLPGSYLNKIDIGFGRSRILNYSLCTKYKEGSAFVSTFIFFFLTVPCGMQDLSSPTRDQTLCPTPRPPSGGMGS